MENFLSKLFNFSFKKFISPQIVQFLYILGIFTASLTTVGIIFASFAAGIFEGITGLIGGLLFFIIYVIFIRIGLEALIASIRTAENTSEIVEMMRENQEKNK